MSGNLWFNRLAKNVKNGRPYFKGFEESSLMVRPIEITDTLSKVQALERMQQNAKAATESVQQFQKELTEKLSGEQVTTANPTAPGDRIILHADERDKDKRRQAEEEASSPGGDDEKPQDEGKPEPEKKPPNPAGHIDITV